MLTLAIPHPTWFVFINAFVYLFICLFVYLFSIWNKRYGEGDDPIIINSGFRSPEVNKAEGGASNSNHLTGCAVDIRCLGIEQALRYAVILLDIADEGKEDFDELLIEKSAKSIWVHFAVRPKDNRRRVAFIKA